MTRRVFLSSLVLFAVLAAGVRADPGLVLADCQVTTLAGERWIVRLRSTGPQAFDATTDGDDLVVRLHAARAGDLTVPPAGAYGTLTLVEDAGGVAVRLAPADAGLRVTARQGSGASEVELRIERR